MRSPWGNLRGYHSPQERRSPDAYEAIAILRDGQFGGNVSVRTFSTHFNEKVLRQQYGEPDEIGRESVTEPSGFGTTQNYYRSIRYGWLTFLVQSDGEIAHVKKGS